MIAIADLVTGMAGIGLLLAATAPYFLPRTRLRPASGVLMWLALLATRALTLVLMAMLLASYLPATETFERLTGWCVHAVLPFVATHLGFSGHRVGETAILLPVVLLLGSLALTLFSFYRAASGLRGWLQASALAKGPAQSVVVGGPEILVAATGLHRARIVVSTGALTSLDPKELRAGLEHERGHITRRHSYVALLADLLFAIARPLPGSRRALDELRFHLERDADEYAVRRTGDPLALAATICKAAKSPSSARPGLIGLSGPGVPTRLQVLLDRSAGKPSARVTGVAHLLALTLLIAAIALLAAAPIVAQASVGHATDLALLCQQ